MTKVKGNTSHPVVTASLFSIIYFNWLSPLLRLGKRKDLSHADLPLPSPTDDSDRLTKKLEAEWDKRKKLFSSLVSVFGLRFFLNSLLITIEETFRIIQILYLIFLMDYFDPDKSVSLRQAIIYCIIIIASLTVCGTMHHPFFWNSGRYGLQVKSAISGLLYNKLFKLRHDQINSGEFTNHLTSDANCFDDFSAYAPFFIIGPAQLGFAIFYLTYYINFTIIGGLILLTALVIVLLITGKVIDWLRSKKQKITDQRLHLTEEVLKNIKNIKFLGLETYFESKIWDIRVKEMFYQTIIHLVTVINALQDIDLTSFATFLSIGGLFLLSSHIQLNPSHVIFAMAFCSRINSSVGYHVSQAIKKLFQFKVSVRRLEKFLQLSDGYTTNLNHIKRNKERCEDHEVKIKVSGLSFSMGDQFSLANLNFESKTGGGELIVVEGESGSGKTNFIKALLGETRITNGSVNIVGSMYYVTQEPWIFNGSIKDNICFGRKFDQQKFDRVLRLCCLDKDLNNRTKFRDGINQVVSDNGIDLSGGQKARINLARAIYYNAQIYLFDNPLSAYDRNVSNFIKRKCIEKYLGSKLRIVFVHDSQEWKSADKIYTLTKNKELAQKKHTKENIIDDNDEIFHDVPEVTAKRLVSRDDSDEMASLLDSRLNLEGGYVTDSSKIAGHVYKIYLSLDKCYGFLVFGLLLFSFISFQAITILADTWVVNWAEQEGKMNKTSFKSLDDASASNRTIDEFFSADDYFRERSFLFYAIFSLSSLFFMFLRPIVYFLMTRHASLRLHRKMFHSVLSTNIGFFITNTVGDIKNRFSNDMITIDDDLPQSSFNFVQVFAFVLGTFALSIYVNYIMLVPIVPLFLTFYIFRNNFMKNSRNLKRLEAEYKGPILGHVNSSLSGLAIIRSTGKDKSYKHKYHEIYNNHTAVNFPFKAMQRWFAIRIDLLVVFFVVCVLAGCIWVKEYFYSNGVINVTSAKIGILLTYLFQLANIFQFCIRQSCSAEADMISSERVKEYIDLKKEKYKDGDSLDQISNGKIVYKNVNLSYKKEEIVLQGLNFEIEACKKIGLVGRTGSGKTTILSALLRMIELKNSFNPANSDDSDNSSGDIFIDGTNISSIKIEDLRKLIAVIPQEASLFDGDMRFNLDPHKNYKNDRELYIALHQIDSNIYPPKSEQDIKAFLDRKIENGGSNFSAGEKQILCVTRAILKKSKIVIIDEATSNLDPETDNLIQRIFRRNLKDSTVLTIAHRIDSIKDYDKIMGLKDGQLDPHDFDTPNNLLNNPNSVLNTLIRHLSPEDQDNFKLGARHPKRFDETLFN